MISLKILQIRANQAAWWLQVMWWWGQSWWSRCFNGIFHVQGDVAAATEIIMVQRCCVMIFVETGMFWADAHIMRQYHIQTVVPYLLNSSSLVNIINFVFNISKSIDKKVINIICCWPENSIEGWNINSCWSIGYRPLSNKNNYWLTIKNYLKFGEVTCLAGVILSSAKKWVFFLGPIQC